MSIKFDIKPKRVNDKTYVEVSARNSLDTDIPIHIKNRSIEGWKKLQLGNVVADSTLGSNYPCYRKVDEKVEVVGNFKCTSFSNYPILLGTLPSGYRPTNKFICYTYANSQRVDVSINTDGTIKLETIITTDSDIIKNGVTIFINYNFPIITDIAD